MFRIFAYGKVQYEGLIISFFVSSNQHRKITAS